MYQKVVCAVTNYPMEMLSNVVISNSSVGRAPCFWRGGCEFESRLRLLYVINYPVGLMSHVPISIAQLVERRAYNAEVTSSNLV